MERISKNTKVRRKPPNYAKSRSVLGNGPAQFGKGATEKGRKAPRRYPTSFGET